MGGYILAFVNRVDIDFWYWESWIMQVSYEVKINFDSKYFMKYSLSKCLLRFFIP